MHIGQALDLVSRYNSLRNPLTSLGDYLDPELISRCLAESGTVTLRKRRLAVLEWQINCAARDGLYAHQIVLESCVTSATENFMSEHGDALTDALAPFLCAPYGLEAAMKILRTAVARQTEMRTPVISAAYKSIIDETGLTVDASMRADASASFTPAQHKVFLARLNRLNEKGVC